MGWQGLYANDALSSVQGGCEDRAPLRPSLGGDGQGYRQTYLQMAEPHLVIPHQESVPGTEI